MTPGTPDGKGRGRTQFLLLAALFFGPLIAAILLYFAFPDLQPKGRTNYGELVIPARPIPPAPLRNADGSPAGDGVLRGKWSFVYVGAHDGCGVDCQRKLFQIRQIRTLLNDKRDRVRRVFVAPDAEALDAARAELEAQHPDLAYYLDSPDGSYRRFFEHADPQALFLVDPLGNWLMWYPGDAEYKGILKDIKRLLKISQIG